MGRLAHLQMGINSRMVEVAAVHIHSLPAVGCSIHVERPFILLLFPVPFWSRTLQTAASVVD